MARRPAWRLRYGWLLVGVTAAATVLVPVATSSGEALERRSSRADRDGAGSPGRGLATGVAVVAVVVALATAVQVYRIGDSGAPAVWGGSVSASSTG